MKNTDILLSISVGLTVASAIASVGAGLAVYAIKRDGVMVQIPVAGRFEIKFDPRSTEPGVILPGSAQSILSVLPILVGLSAIVGAVAADAMLSKSGGPSAGPSLPPIG